MVLNIIETYAPLKRRFIRPNPPGWMTADVVANCKKRDSLKEKSIESKFPEDWVAYKRSRNRATFMIRKAKKRYFKTKFPKHCKTRSIWSNVDELTNYKVKESPKIESLIDPSSQQCVSEHEKKSSILAASFTVNFAPSENDMQDSENIKNHILLPHDTLLPETTFSSVTPDEVS
jgi:hypothetical protein